MHTQVNNVHEYKLSWRCCFFLIFHFAQNQTELFAKTVQKIERRSLFRWRWEIETIGAKAFIHGIEKKTKTRLKKETIICRPKVKANQEGNNVNKRAKVSANFLRSVGAVQWSDFHRKGWSHGLRSNTPFRILSARCDPFAILHGLSNGENRFIEQLHHGNRKDEFFHLVPGGCFPGLSTTLSQHNRIGILAPRAIGTELMHERFHYWAG